MDENEWLAERFEEHRSRLRAVAYRMLGSPSEADDAVQEAWLRFSRANTSAVENLGSWLSQTWTGIVSFAGPIWNGLVNTFKYVWDRITGDKDGAANALKAIRSIADLGGTRGRGLQCVARGPALAPDDAVELHREPPLSWKSAAYRERRNARRGGPSADTHGYVICWTSPDARV